MRTETQALPMLTAAIDYAARGISVVPLHDPTAGHCSCIKGPDCASSGKHPRLDWKPYQERRAEADEIRAWWDRWPTANVGIVTGTISGLCVLDIDYRNGGFETLVELDHHGAAMPDDNPVAITGSEGLHHYFALDAALPKSAPFQGIDIQADGALVVAPPSRHASGRSYRWARSLDTRWPVIPHWIRWAVAEYEGHAAAPPSPPLPDADQDDVLAALQAAGLYLGRHRRAGLHRIRCPWRALHSNGDPEAVVIEPGGSAAPGWAFRCLHGHCADRSIGDLLSLLRIPRRRAVS
jgi:Bifunctional DNA primase/polymerase, N-terminal